jgi:Zn-dependent protease with chaperone function
MKWETHAIESETVNAFCMPGGKMAIYTGIIDKLHLTDDEIAVVMGHEITHALREHSYKRMKTQLGTNALISVAGAATGRNMTAFDIGNMLWQLSNSRDHEHEADSG